MKTINYKGTELEIKGGFWLDIMNRCFYSVIDKIPGFDICQTIQYNIKTKNDDIIIFALPNPNNE